MYVYGYNKSNFSYNQENYGLINVVYRLKTRKLNIFKFKKYPRVINQWVSGTCIVNGTRKTWILDLEHTCFKS